MGVVAFDWEIFVCLRMLGINGCRGLLHKKDVTDNIYVFPLVTEQYTKCSNGFFVLLKMGKMMLETC